MKSIYFIIPVILLIFAVLFIVIFHFKKKMVIQKINSMSINDKKYTLNSIAEAAGYQYDPYQDIFVATLDAPQKIFGYHTFFDSSAPYFNMIFDYETIYFNYKARTWLIEMWKGQYGINSGCELGIYYADKIIPSKEYHSTNFQVVDAKDMLDISLKLNRHCPKNRNSCQYTKLGYMRKKHWWLTIFKMGTFTKPKDLFVNTSITFKDYSMMYNFLDSFKNTMPDTTYKISGLTVYFTFYQSNRKYSLFKKMVRKIALLFCQIYCKWFHYLTRPFSKSGDKLLYLYYYLPFIIRHILK